MVEETAVPSHLLSVLTVGGQQALAEAIGDLVRAWFTKHGWSDSLEQLSFTTYHDFHRLPPAEWPVAAIMLNGDNHVEDRLCAEGEDGFWDWFDTLGLQFNTRSAGVHHISIPDDAPAGAGLHTRLATLQAFEWHAHLVAPDYTAIYRTVFEHFGRHPEHFGALQWRGFEQLCASVFTAQGYTTELGKGRNDGGVDIRLTSHPVYGQQVTVVQVKQQRKKIELNLVQGILGAAHGEGADRSLFVTSSSFLPGAERWAHAQGSTIPLELADRQKVAEWCRDIPPSRDWIRQQATSWNLGSAKVVVASIGVRMINSAWAAVVAETPLAARLFPLGAHHVRMPTDPMRGTVTPVMPRVLPEADCSFTARRDGDRYSGDDGRFYDVWDGQPRYFDDAD
ncbi:restriction endonuclease [Catellatospora sp. NPDC049111]|uniref:restriction endonuclease n=1 Tax=Catellatospora sp. NPDC049111 TaxID=3155271 RepID=UPI0033F75377